MKRFIELSELEIKDLTDEQVKQFVKYEFAENGIKFLEKPKDPGYHKCPVEEITHYVIGNFRFKNRDEADEVSSILKSCKSLVDYTWDYSKKIEKPLNDQRISISEDSVISLNDADSVKCIDELNKDLRHKYEVLIEEYNLNEEKAEPIRDEIYSKVRSVKEKYSYLDRLTSIFESEYIPLADGDIEKAMAFFKKAYSINEEAEEYILQ